MEAITTLNTFVFSWDNEYARELEVFKEFGDIGEVWYVALFSLFFYNTCFSLLRFGYDCQTRVVNWIKESPDIGTESHIIDLGCGNGSLLVELVRINVM